MDPDIIIYLKSSSSHRPAPIDKYIFSTIALLKKDIARGKIVEKILIIINNDIECITLSAIIPNKKSNFISEDINKSLFLKKINSMIAIKNKEYVILP